MPFVPPLRAMDTACRRRLHRYGASALGRCCRGPGTGRQARHRGLHSTQLHASEWRSSWSTWSKQAAAPFFDYADLTEMHHEAKIDAPSGYSPCHRPGRRRRQGRTGFDRTSSREGVRSKAPAAATLSKAISVHSARMPGRVAHHELVFGALGQTLTIRHDSINRESFMPGVMMAITRRRSSRTGLTVGLENILGL